MRRTVQKNAVHGDLLSRFEQENVVHDDLLCGDGALGPAAYDFGRGGADQVELIDAAFGQYFQNDAPTDIDGKDEREGELRYARARIDEQDGDDGGEQVEEGQ